MQKRCTKDAKKMQKRNKVVKKKELAKISSNLQELAKNKNFVK
jgi:hypothetical protein